MKATEKTRHVDPTPINNVLCSARDRDFTRYVLYVLGQILGPSMNFVAP